MERMDGGWRDESQKLANTYCTYVRTCVYGTAVDHSLGDIVHISRLRSVRPCICLSTSRLARLPAYSPSSCQTVETGNWKKKEKKEKTMPVKCISWPTGQSWAFSFLMLQWPVEWAVVSPWGVGSFWLAAWYVCTFSSKRWKLMIRQISLGGRREKALSLNLLLLLHRW